VADPSASTPGTGEIAPPREPFQILSLDGGGIKGLFAASVLAALETDLKTNIVDHFDLAVGTSTGGIVALALGAGLRPTEIVDLYTRMGASVFAGSHVRGPRRLVRSKFEPGPLRTALQTALGDRQLWQSVVPLVIPAYDLTSDRIHLFKTPHHERLRRDWPLRMTDVAMATSAAPTYLPAYELDGIRFVDGGVWANNPVMVGIAEAVSMFGRSLEDIRVFSLSTTSDLRDRHPSLDRGGIVQWAGNAVDVVLSGQSMGANTAALHLLGDRLMRVDEPVPAGVLRIDRIDRKQLIGRARTVSRMCCPEFATNFVAHRAARFEPHRHP
jgi:patatin-like phospholipase/acyl hydrolase